MTYQEFDLVGCLQVHTDVIRAGSGSACALVREGSHSDAQPLKSFDEDVYTTKHNDCVVPHGGSKTEEVKQNQI